MKQINSLQLHNQAAFEVFKDLNGGMVIRINSESVRLTPRQSYDVAIVLLKTIGTQINETAKRPDDLGGDPLKAKIKIV